MHEGLSWHREVLANGLTILLYPRLSDLTAQLSVAIKYGSNDDEVDEAGKAHYLEHLIVGGSRKRICLHHEIERLGGCSSFETSAECTFSTVDVLPDKIAEASRVLSGLLFDEEFESDKLALERKVILNEIAEAADNPRDKVAETLIKCLFKKHPIRNPVLGTKRSINKLELSELEETCRTQYSPNNMILILTGRFTQQDLERVLTDFGDKQKLGPTNKPLRPVEESEPKENATITRPGLGQAYLCFGLRSPPARDHDAVALDLTNAILGLGESSRLFVELREKRALTYDFSSMNISGLDYGFFTVASAVQPRFLNQTLKIIKSELKKITSSPVSEDELQKSKNLIVGDILRAIDNPHELPRLITDTEIVYANKTGLKDYLNNLLELKKDDIEVTSKKYFQEKNYSTATLIPK